MGGVNAVSIFSWLIHYQQRVLLTGEVFPPPALLLPPGPAAPAPPPTQLPKRHPPKPAPPPRPRRPPPLVPDPPVPCCKGRMESKVSQCLLPGIELRLQVQVFITHWVGVDEWGGRDGANEGENSDERELHVECLRCRGWVLGLWSGLECVRKEKKEVGGH